MELYSPDVVDIIVTFEEEFGMEIPERKMMGIVTVGM